MELGRILDAIDELSPSERQQVRARLNVLDGLGPDAPTLADPVAVQQAARELMQRFPDSLRRLAGR